MAPVLGSKVSAKRGSAVLEALRSWLQPGEDVRLVVRANRVNPLLDLLVVTDRRVLGVGSFDLAERGPKLAVDRADITAFHVRMTLIDPRRLCVTTSRGTVSFGNLDKADVEAVQHALSLVPDHAESAAQF
jgi:hypothetical protein